MATRAYIGIENKDHSVTAIYNHNDGYPDHLFNTLSKYYNSKEKALELINLGDVSFVGEKINPIGKNHSFDTPEYNVTIAYCRDRGEEFHQFKFNSSYNYLLEAREALDIEYIYIWLDGQWWYMSVDDDRFVSWEEWSDLSLLFQYL